MVMLEVQYELGINGVVEEMTDCGNVDMVPIQESLARLN